MNAYRLYGYRRIRLVFAACMLSFMALAVRAQAHADDFGDYIVRSSAITADRLPAQTARMHGIERGTDIGVLNVSVFRKSDPFGSTVPARVSATIENLLGQRESIAMREVTENDRMSYLGTFEFPPRRMLRFEVRVQPEGTLAVHTQRFEERLFAGRE